MNSRQLPTFLRKPLGKEKEETSEQVDIDVAEMIELNDKDDDYDDVSEGDEKCIEVDKLLGCLLMPLPYR